MLLLAKSDTDQKFRTPLDPVNLEWDEGSALRLRLGCEADDLLAMREKSALPVGHMLTVHPRCKYLARTLPLMVQSRNNPEDLDSDSDDHACDATRYLLMGGLRPDTGRRTPAEVPAYSGAWWRKMSGNRNARGVLA